MHYEVESEEELQTIVPQLWQEASTRNILLFRGDLGAGKTTLIKALGKHLGITDTMSSPSFGIVNEYQINSTVMYHVDLYRIKDLNEIYEFGLPEILDSGAICMIEWPEMTEEIWQDYDYSDISITAKKSGTRRIFVK